MEFLKKGENYRFLILKRISDTIAGNEILILQGPDNGKYILDGSFYDHYDLKTGHYITCKVDKVNCSGQVFLEPEHPIYKEGQEYIFSLVDVNEESDAWGNPLFNATVKDIQEQKWHCIVNRKAAELKGLTHLKCRIEKIKKSSLYLSSVDYPLEKDFLIPGEHYKFKVKGEINSKGSDYYVLEGPDGKMHLILKEYYRNYGFRPGQFTTAEVIRQRSDLSYKIEPEHPLYEIGGSYNFRFIKLEIANNPAGETEGVINVSDELGTITRVKAKQWQLDELDYKPDWIKCKVVGFKKGRLQLENLE